MRRVVEPSSAPVLLRLAMLSLACCSLALGQGTPAETPATDGGSAAGKSEAMPKDIIRPEGILLRLDGVDITQVIDLYSRVTDKIVLPVPDLKGKITIINRKRIPAPEAARLIESALELQGWTIIPEGKIAKLVKSKDAVKRMVPTLSPTAESELDGISRIQTHLFALRYAKGDEVKNMISPLLSNDGTIQFNERTNLLVVTEVSTNMSRLMELIQQVDRPLSTREEFVDAVALKFVAPKKMAESIKDYFKSTTLKYLPDERLQTLILTGKQQEVAQAVRLIQKLDLPVPKEQTQNQILRINYAKATEVAQLIDKLYKGRADAPPPTFSVNADKDSNSLILTGPPELREEIAGLVSRIDIRYQQVMLKVLIGEINITPELTLGVQWAHLASSASELAQDFGAIGNSIGRSQARTSTTGLRYSLIRPNAYSTFINALASNDTFNVLASPHITVSNNKPAQFIVGNRVPVQTSERISTGNDVVRNNEFVDVGLTLKATPSITPGGEVALDLEMKFSEQGPPNPGFVNPTFSNRETKTSVIIADEHTLVIGGLMRRSLKKNETKVPLLGDMPVLGPLFRRTFQEKERQELVVLLTPTVIDKSADGDAISAAYKDRSFKDKNWESFKNDWSDTVKYMENLSRKAGAATTAPAALAPTVRVDWPAPVEAKPKRVEPRKRVSRIHATMAAPAAANEDDLAVEQAKGDVTAKREVAIIAETTARVETPAKCETAAKCEATAAVASVEPALRTADSATLSRRLSDLRARHGVPAPKPQLPPW